jgi:two-component system NtrC family response regulator
MAKIFIIDDDRMICDALANAMERMGHEACYELTLKSGMREVFVEQPDVVFLDVRLPDGNGLAALPKIREAPFRPEVIIITGEGDPDGAELAIKSGAWDYIEKPPSIDAMTLPLIRALQYREEKKGKKPSVSLKRDNIIGNSSKMIRCLDLLAQAANSDANVLIIGETGTGKELFANAIHLNSPREERNFVVVDCASLPETLVESTLFGHEKGAFTGAVKSHDGLVKQADGGTLFLDEVGELPLAVQKSFLRVLEGRRYRPVGGKSEKKSDFRLVAATNRNLDRMVKDGRFRQDLLYRLRSVTIDLPALQNRTDDIKDLAIYFMSKFCERYGVGTKGFSPEFIETLMTYSWPGNVREVANTMENLLTTTEDDPILFPKHLPTPIRVEVTRASVGRKEDEDDIQNETVSIQPIGPLKDFRETAITQAERSYLKSLMAYTDWDIKESCSVSGLSRPRLYALLKKYQIFRGE